MTRPVKRRRLFGPHPLPGALGLLSALTACGGGTAEIRVDPAERYQTVSGWEASAEIGLEVIQSEPLRDSLIVLATDVLGINRLRVSVRASSESPVDNFAALRAGTLSAEDWRCIRYSTVNDNASADSIDWSGFTFTELDEAVEQIVLPMSRRLADRGERLHLNLNYVAFTRQICGDRTYIHSEQPEEYAEFVLALFLHLQETYGLVPDTWEMILEPDLSGAWTGQQIGHALVATARRLSAHGFEPRFAAPSTSNTSAAAGYFDELVSVPGAAELLDEFPYHRYGITTRAELVAIADRARRYGVATSMLEKMDAGAEQLHEDLTLVDVVAWQQFALAYPIEDNGDQLISYQVEDGRFADIQLGREARYLAQYFRYVRAGAQRIGASSSSEAVAPAAFVGADGAVVLVVRNERERDLLITGLPAGRYGITRTTESESMVDLGEHAVVENGEIATRAPAGAVVTVFSLDGRSAP